MRAARGLADQQPEPGPQPLAALLERVRLVVRADAGRRVRLQVLAEHSGRVPVHVLGSLELQLGQLGLVAGDDPGEVHHLREPENASAAQQALEVAGRQRPPRRFECGGGHARGRHEPDVERQSGADVEEPVDTVGAEHVRDLVRIGNHGRRAERQDEPCELVDQQLRRLEVHVRVDESGHDVATRRVQHLRPVVGADAGDVAVAHRDVRVEPLAREDG